MNKRIDLHHLLEDLLGSKNVYFQPPPSIKMKFPAIVYHRDDIYNKHADDSVYKQNIRYLVTVIDYDPDSEIVSKVSKLQHCKFNRSFKSDNLNHDVFVLYF